MYRNFCPSLKKRIFSHRGENQNEPWVFVCLCVCMSVCGHFQTLTQPKRMRRFSWDSAHELECQFTTDCLKYYGMHRFYDILVVFFYFLEAALWWPQLLSNFLSEVSNLKGMLGVEFETDPFIFTVSSMKSSDCHFRFC